MGIKKTVYRTGERSLTFMFCDMLEDQPYTTGECLALGGQVYVNLNVIVHDCSKYFRVILFNP